MTVLHFVCRLCTLLHMRLNWVRQNYSTDMQGRRGWRGGVEHFICHWRTENRLPAHLKRREFLCINKSCLAVGSWGPVDGWSEYIKEDWLTRQTEDWAISAVCKRMYCACSSLVLPLALKPGDYTSTKSQLCAFVLALPSACCSNWFFSERATSAAPFSLYLVGLTLIRANFYCKVLIQVNHGTYSRIRALAYMYILWNVCFFSKSTTVLICFNTRSPLSYFQFKTSLSSCFSVH